MVATVRLRDLTRLWTPTELRWLLIGPVILLWFLRLVLISARAVVAAAPGRLEARAIRAAAIPGVCGSGHDPAARLRRLVAAFVQWAGATIPLVYDLLSAVALGGVARRQHGAAVAGRHHRALRCRPPCRQR